MDEFLRLAIVYLNGIRRYRWIIFILPALVSPVGWFVVATMPDQWAASARLYVDTDSVLRPLMKGLAVRLDDDRRIRMMTKLLFSRQMLEKLARMTDLDLTAKTPQEMESLVDSLKNRVKLKGSRANIYTLSFQDESPDLAKRVVQSFLTIFVETNLGESRKDQDSAAQFLMQETKDYERRLIEAERKLKEFKARNLAYLSDRGNYYSRLQKAKASLQQAKLEQQISEQRRDELQQQIDDFEAEGHSALPFEEGGSFQMSPLELRIQSLQTQLDDLLIRYTERHPEVIALHGAIERLEQKLEEEVGAMQDEDEAGYAGGEDITSHPVYQQLRLLLSEAQADVASKQAIASEFQRRIEKLAADVDRVLEVEAEQKQLNRDYGIIAKKHSGLLERIESLRLGRQVDTTAETVRFRVIEPPKVPEKPAGPNRILFSSLVFAASLGAGLGAALLMTLLRPTFFDRRQLTDETDIPVLGSVNMIWTDAMKRRRRLYNLVYTGAFSILIVAYGAVIAAYRFELDVMSRLAGL